MGPGGEDEVGSLRRFKNWSLHRFVQTLALGITLPLLPRRVPVQHPERMQTCFSNWYRLRMSLSTMGLCVFCLQDLTCALLPFLGSRTPSVRKTRESQLHSIQRQGSGHFPLPCLGCVTPSLYSKTSPDFTGLGSWASVSWRMSKRFLKSNPRNRLMNGPQP